nr:MAG TPA: CHD-like protein [Caudoviricetes sp.]
MSNLKEKIAVADVWTGKKLEKDIAELKSSHSKEVEKLKRKVAELEYDLDSLERAFLTGIIGLTIFNLAVVVMFVF